MKRYAPAATLGFALGGFFDGILLHQILQWHHLLSLVPGVTELRMQVLWDGPSRYVPQFPIVSDHAGPAH